MLVGDVGRHPRSATAMLGQRTRGFFSFQVSQAAILSHG